MSFFVAESLNGIQKPVSIIVQIRVYRGVDAKDFFEKKSSALPKNFEKGWVNLGLSNCLKFGKRSLRVILSGENIIV